jgi:nucleoside-diphosphate-sugar epimerase
MGRCLGARWAGSIVGIDRPHDLATYDPGWVALFAGASAVVHLAADPNSFAGIESAQGNILSTINVIRASEQHGVNRIVFASSVWADPARFGIPHPRTYYSAAKLAGEALVCATGKTAVCLRLGLFDPGQTVHPDYDERLRLSEDALVGWFDRALAHDGRCVVWNAVPPGI